MHVLSSFFATELTELEEALAQKSDELAEARVQVERMRAELAAVCAAADEKLEAMQAELTAERDNVQAELEAEERANAAEAEVEKQAKKAYEERTNFQAEKDLLQQNLVAAEERATAAEAARDAEAEERANAAEAEVERMRAELARVKATAESVIYQASEVLLAKEAELEAEREELLKVKEEARETLADAGKIMEELNHRESDLIGREDRLSLGETNNLVRSRELSAQERDIKDREKDLARREDQTNAEGQYVSRVNDGRNLLSNNDSRTYWRDYNPRLGVDSGLDKSSKDYWKDYVTGEIAGNQASIKDSELIKNTIVPAAAIGSVGVFIATAATGLTFMLSIAAALLAIAIFVFKDCQDEITNGKDNIKELSNNKNRSTNYLAEKGASGSLRLQ